MSFSAAMPPRCLQLARVAQQQQQQQVHQRHAFSVLQQLLLSQQQQSVSHTQAATAAAAADGSLLARLEQHAKEEERAGSSAACSTSNGPARALRDGNHWLALHGEQRRAFFGLSSAPPQSKKFSQRRLVGWTSDQLYAVVSDVDQYSKFVPWCQRSVVTKRPGANNSGTYLEAELEVGFQVLVERYVSQVTLHPGKRVESKVQDSMLFDHLDSTWSMEPGPAPNTCWLTFQVDFAFNNALYGHLADVFFSEVVQRMVSAFESRCHQLYGTSSLVRPAASGTRPASRAASSSAAHQHQQRPACMPAGGRHSQLPTAAAGASAQRAAQHPHQHQQQQQQQMEHRRGHELSHVRGGSDAAEEGAVQPARGS